jgi:hypothetical protein
VIVHEFAFTAVSVGRLALSLHQAIRNHRVALPDDEDLLDELVSVRLRKNSLGVYRLDHDSGQHDDQAVALALGTHHLLDAEDSGAQWVAWARRKAEAAIAARELRQLEPAAAVRSVPAPDRVVPDAQVPLLEGVVLAPVGARQAARNAAWAEQGWKFAALR